MKLVARALRVIWCIGVPMDAAQAGAAWAKGDMAGAVLYIALSAMMLAALILTARLFDEAERKEAP